MILVVSSLGKRVHLHVAVLTDLQQAQKSYMHPIYIEKSLLQGELVDVVLFSKKQHLAMNLRNFRIPILP